MESRNITGIQGKFAGTDFRDEIFDSKTWCKLLLPEEASGGYMHMYMHLSEVWKTNAEKDLRIIHSRDQ